MAKLYILSLILMTLIMPIWLARERSPKKTMKKVQWVAVIFILIWTQLALYRYPALVPLD